GDGLRRDLPARRRPRRRGRRCPALLTRPAPRRDREQAARRQALPGDLARRQAHESRRQARKAARSPWVVLKRLPGWPRPPGARFPAAAVRQHGLPGLEEGGPPPARASFLST